LVDVISLIRCENAKLGGENLSSCGTSPAFLVTPGRYSRRGYESDNEFVLYGSRRYHLLAGKERLWPVGRQECEEFMKPLEIPSCDDRLTWDTYLSIYHFPTLVAADDRDLCSFAQTGTGNRG
jgi:hypothetical protein